MAWTRTLFGVAGTTVSSVFPDTFVGELQIKGPRPWVDVRAYGAKGDGSTNDTTAITNALAAAAAGGVVLIPPSANPYVISGDPAITVSLARQTVLCFGELKYTGTGTAIRITGTDGQWYSGGAGGGRIYRAITVSGDPNTALVGNGIHLQGARNWVIYNPRIEGFQRGLYFDGGGAALTGYIWIYSPLLIDNLVGYETLYGANGTNEVATFGGRFSISSGWSTFTNTRYIKLAGSSTNGHRFFGASVEGGTNRPERKLYVEGHDNGFYEMRWEGANGGTDVEFTAAAADNRVHYGNFLEGQVILDNGAQTDIQGNLSKKLSGSLAWKVKSVTADYSAANEPIILADAATGAVIITLPAASGKTGRRYEIKKTDSSTNKVSLSRTGSDTIDGNATVVLPRQHSAAIVTSDGTNWKLLARTDYPHYESGATSVADGGTVSHNLAVAPTKVRVTPSVSGEMVSVTALGATNFTVAIKKHDGTAGTTQTVYWEAEA